MKSIRIYKDDIRVHVLRSLFFTDTVLALSGGAILAGLLYFLFQNLLHFFNWGYFLSSLIVTEIFFIAFVTQKIDNQPIFRIVPRGIVFKTNKKQFRQKELEPYFVDFSIQDNLILKRNSVVKMYEVEPFDIALLNDEDREHFFVKLKQTIHMLPSQVQFIVRKERTTTDNYSKHFFSLYDQSNKKRETLIDNYITDLTSLINNQALTTTHHYAVFSISCDTTKPYEKLKAIKKLHDIGIRFASSLATCNITIRPLANEELINFSQSILR